jgi:hypothetical protein
MTIKEGVVGAPGFEPGTNGSTVHGSARFLRGHRNGTPLSYAPIRLLSYFILLKGLLLVAVHNAQDLVNTLVQLISIDEENDFTIYVTKVGKLGNNTET